MIEDDWPYKGLTDEEFDGVTELAVRLVSAKKDPTLTAAQCKRALSLFLGSACLAMANGDTAHGTIIMAEITADALHDMLDQSEVVNETYVHPMKGTKQ